MKRLTGYRIRLYAAAYLFAVMAFAVLAFGGIERSARTAIEVAVFALAAAWTARRLVAPFPVAGSWFAVPIAAMALISLAQFISGHTASRYITSGYFVQWCAYTLFFLLCVNVFQDRSIARSFQSGLVWFGFAVALFGLVQFYLFPETLYGVIDAPRGAVFGPFADRNHFAVFMELVIPAALLAALRGEEKRTIYFVVCGLLVAAVVVCASRMGAIVVAAECGVVLVAAAIQLRGSWKTASRRAMLPIGGLALVAIAFTVAAGPRKLLERFETVEGDVNRFQVARAAWQQALERPLTGFGAGTFSIVYPSFAEFDDGHAWNYAHNDTAQMALELGLAGAIVPFLLAGLILFRKRRKEIWLGAALPLLAGWAHSWTEFPAQMPGLVLVALVLLAQIAGAEANSPHRVRRRRRSARGGAMHGPIAGAQLENR